MNAQVGVAALKPTRIDIVLVVYSEALSPSELTSRLGIEPTKTTEKGTKLGQRSGALMQIPRHVWQLSSESSVSTMDWATHLDWLIERLTPVREQLTALQDSKEVECALTGIVWTSGSSAHVRIAARHMEALVALRLDLQLEFADYGDDN
jgi:hypothetical protein